MGSISPTLAKWVETQTQVVYGDSSSLVGLKKSESVIKKSQVVHKMS